MTIASPPSFREAFSSIAARYPEDVRRGPWTIRHVTVSRDEARFAALRAFIRDGRFVPAGDYIGLWHDSRGVVMSATPDEMRETADPYLRAARRPDRSTRVLINGMGLGMLVSGLLLLPNVEHVQVIEVDADVIALAELGFTADLQTGRLSIEHADALTWQPPKGARYDIVWHDIWDALCTDNLPSMGALKRRYARRADYHACWGESQVRQYQRRGW